MDKIIIKDLEVFYHVGVPDEERAQVQRLLLTVELFVDFQRAAAADDLRLTVDYFAVTQRLLAFGRDRNWKLIEKLVTDLATAILKEFSATGVTVEVKKFIVPQTRYIAARIERGITGKPD